MENSFNEMMSQHEANFDAQQRVELNVTESLNTITVASHLAELYIPIAAGAAVKITTGNDAEPKQPENSMPDFAWRYKAPNDDVRAEDPRDRFKFIDPA